MFQRDCHRADKSSTAEGNLNKMVASCADLAVAQSGISYPSALLGTDFATTFLSPMVHSLQLRYEGPHK